MALREIQRDLAKGFYQKGLLRLGASRVTDTPRERTFRYVTHDKREAFERVGWLASDLGPPHCFYAVLMEWIGQGEPVLPVEIDNV